MLTGLILDNPVAAIAVLLAVEAAWLALLAWAISPERLP